MAEVEVVVPSLGESVTEAQIGSWLKPDGATVRADEILLELETDKAAMEIPAPASGKLTVVAQPGQIVKPGDVIARIDTSVAAEPAAATPSNAAPAPPEQASTADAPSAPQAPAPPPPPAAATPADAPASPKTSPAVRKLLAEHGLDASQIPATGRGGRLTKADVESALEARQASAAAPQADGAPAEPAAAPPAPQMPRIATQSDGSETERVPMTLLRRRIAERLVEAQRTAAILTTFNEIDMSATIALRKQYRDAFEKKHGVRLGFMSLFGRACIEALQEIREVNAQIDGTDIVYNRHVHLGIAVGTPRGLVVPVIRYADQMSIAELEQAIAALAGKARDGKLTPDDLTGGTFTISNGGVYGSLLSTPILNPPQTGILGMHKIEERPVVVDGEIVIRPMMYVALSYDHRLIDGEQAVTFLVRVKQVLEDPARMLLGV